MAFTTDIASLASTLGLKRTGNEYHGPCPVCGGTDRFWIRPGKTKDIVMACRQGCDYSSLAKEMTQRGLMVRDEDYIKPMYRQHDLDHCDAMLKIARGTHFKDYCLSNKDMAVFRDMLGKVDSARKGAILELFREKQQLPPKWEK